VDRTAERTRVAAIAAGIFASLDGVARSPSNGTAPSTGTSSTSNWKQAARREALRSQLTTDN
jgi:hypothetical protein